MRRVHERPRLRVHERRAAATDPFAKAVGKQLTDEVGSEHEDEQPGLPPEDGEHGRRDEEDCAVRPDPGEADEEPVDPADAVVDDPALEMLVGRDQVGSSCFVWSISCCGLKGLPTKPCAPRDAASAGACSSTLPLNMITGIAPTPCRS
jgi:hypothetical protein